ncbi:hypothetical protein BD626DRAFT_106582 [Schizophyllum amplum]|uniref:DUF6593 domain-containing protein n=1 Tax=Schizophyllum amplum TaxID=97359 RepID=A0A550CSP9_9AGAR|nr:hypothetical protein BD626DRAFT_106582 [Auriculariopsis ampla]
MEATFDNKTNLFNASLRSKVDDSVLYTLTTKSGYRGKKHTVITDANPAPGHSATAGVIHWKEEAFEIGGQRKPCKELKQVSGSLFKKVRHWQWASDRKKYEMRYEEETWKAFLLGELVATFYIPSHPKLFGKLKPSTLQMDSKALLEDEVFLLLAFVYLEVKRQEKTNSAALT